MALMAPEAVEEGAGEARAALLSGKGPLSWYYDQLPAGLAGSERIVSVLSRMPRTSVIVAPGSGWGRRQRMTTC
jgi:hypothetical protein